MGFYPVAPGTGEYVLGSPLFDKVILTPQNGKPFTVLAKGNSEEAVYINKAYLNGKSHLKNFISHDELTKGGRLIFYMKSEPSLTRGIREEDVPYSMSSGGEG